MSWLMWPRETEASTGTPPGTKEIKGTRVTRAARETKAARGIREISKEISKEISHLPKKSAGIRLSRR